MVVFVCVCALHMHEFVCVSVQLCVFICKPFVRVNTPFIWYYKCFDKGVSVSDCPYTAL